MSTSIDDIITLVKRLEANGLAYAVDGDVYYGGRGVRAILPEAQAEFVVPLGETCLEGLSHALGRLAAAPETRAHLAAANRERLLQRFTKQRMVAAYRELYERALGA